MHANKRTQADAIFDRTVLSKNNSVQYIQKSKNHNHVATMSKEYRKFKVKYILTTSFMSLFASFFGPSCSN